MFHNYVCPVLKLFYSFGTQGTTLKNKLNNQTAWRISIWYPGVLRGASYKNSLQSKPCQMTLILKQYSHWLKHF